MTKSELNAAVKAFKVKTRDALQTMYDAMNNGQQKQIIKNAAVRELFDIYGVEYTGKESGI